MKTCTKCYSLKALEDFHKDSRGKEGRRASCKQCDLLKKRVQYGTDAAYKDRVRSYQRGRSDHYKELNKEWRKENKASIRDRVRERYQTSIIHRAHKKALSAQYRRSKVSAQPVWLSEKDKDRIKDMYLLAEDLQIVSGQKYQVDHIIPLRSKTVCGLHVPWNLQVLPADLNLAKGNKYED
jgi:hypothetical protein